MRHPLRLVFCAALAAPTLASGSAAASTEASRSQRLDSNGYREFVDSAREGLFITPGRALAAASERDLERVVEEFLEAGPGSPELRAAALIHTEAAFLAGANAPLHLQHARGFLKALPDPLERDAWLHRWHLAVGFSYHVSLNSTAAVAMFDLALADFPGDREIQEAFARLLAMAGRLRDEPPYLARAADLLREMLGVAPHPELRVRLASVLAELGDFEGAAAELERAEVGRLRAGPGLVAALVRGQVALETGDFEAAEAAFAEAVERSGRSPGAVSGLVSARLALGDSAGAAEAARTLLARRPAEWEPEWRYWLGPALDFPGMFLEMKEEIRDGSEDGPAGGVR